MDNPLQALTEYVARIEADNAALTARIAEQERVIAAVRELCDALEIYRQLAETPREDSRGATPEAAAPARKSRPSRQGMPITHHTPDETAAWRKEFLAGATSREIAVKHGTRPSTVSSYLTREGVKRKDRYPTAPADSAPPEPPCLHCGGDVNAGDTPGRDGWCAACLARELNGRRITPNFDAS